MMRSTSSAKRLRPGRARSRAGATEPMNGASGNPTRPAGIDETSRVQSAMKAATPPDRMEVRHSSAVRPVVTFAPIGGDSRRPPSSCSDPASQRSATPPATTQTVRPARSAGCRTGEPKGTRIDAGSHVVRRSEPQPVGRDAGSRPASRAQGPSDPPSDPARSAMGRPGPLGRGPRGACRSRSRRRGRSPRSPSPTRPPAGCLSSPRSGCARRRERRPAGRDRLARDRSMRRGGAG